MSKPLKSLRAPMAIALLATGAFGVPAPSFAQEPEVQSIATTPDPLVLMVSDDEGRRYTVLAEPKRWWSSGERGGSIGRKVIEGGVPYLFSYDPGVFSTDYDLRPLAGAEFSVRLSGRDRFDLDMPGLSFKPEKIFLAMCPADIKAPRRTECLYTDDVRFKVAGKDTPIRSVHEPKLYTFLFLARHVHQSGNGRLRIQGQDGASARTQWELAESAEATRVRQVAIAEKKDRDQREQAHQAKTQREQEARRLGREYIQSASRGRTLMCDSGDWMLTAGKPLASLPMWCSFPQVGRAEIDLAHALDAGWSIESQTLSDASNVIGEGGRTVSLVLRRTY